ncbi:MAG: beta-lactamase family protein [Crocinitomicaceae bacterium]|nr:beta-lactamase family protein [Crocinitomicaceae bacterium]
MFKHLLTHSSGLPNILPNSLEDLLTIDFLKKDTPSKINSILKEYDKETFLKDLDKISIDTIPGFKCSYSRAGTELAAYILEEVYQDDFEDILVAFLNDKIGMTETKIRLAKKLQEK